MRHHHDRLVLEEPVEALHDRAFVVRVQRVGRLVEEEVLRILVGGPRDQKPLFLPDAQSVSVGTDLRVVAQGQFVDEGVDVGDARGAAHPLHVGPFVRDADITGYGIRKDVSLLHDRTACPAPARRAVLRDAAVMEQHFARGRRVEAQHQLEHRGLPRAARPDNGRNLVRRDRYRHVVERFGRVRAVVLERYAPEFDVGIVGNHADAFFVGRLLVVFLLNFRKAFERDLRILRRLHELDELRQRCVELTDDVLQGDHHAEGHIALDDGRGCEERDDDVLGLVDERAAHLLRLPQNEPFDGDLEQPRLNALPFPAFLFFAVVEFDVLHTIDELHDVALVGCRLLEAHVVELAATLHEEQDPADVECTAQQEDAENRRVVAAHHGSVDDERHDGHRHAQQRAREERLNAVVVADALHDVAHHLRIEEGDRKTHELGQKVRDERNADPGGHV